MSVIDVIVAALLLFGALLSFAAGVGVLRFPDPLARLHAMTKPQVLGLACVLAAVALDQRSWGVLATLVAVLLFQLVTAPAAAHMIARAGHRSGDFRRELLFVDDLEGEERAEGIAAPPGSHGRLGDG